MSSVEQENPTPIDAAGNLDATDRARGLIQEIIAALTEHYDEFKIAESELKKLYEQLTGKEFEKTHFKPTSFTTWDWLIGFGDNGRKCVPRSNKPPETWINLDKHHLDRIAQIVIRLGVCTDAPQFSHAPSTWEEFLRHVLLAVTHKSSGDQRPESEIMHGPRIGRGNAAGLHYIGDNADGIKWFLEKCQGATVVYNTVFSRSNEKFFIKAELSRYTKVIKTLLAAGCEWNDIVFPSEKAGIEEFYRGLSNKQKANYRARLVRRVMPLFQCLTIHYEEQFAVLVGWAFPGTESSRVYYSENADDCRYFQLYCQHLFDLEDNVEMFPRRIRRRGRSARKPVAKARTR